MSEITGIYSNTVIQHYESNVSVNYSKTEIKTADTAESKENTMAAGEGAIYEKGDNVQNAGYSINKMSESDRARIVEQMKADAAQRKEQLVNLVHLLLRYGEYSGAGIKTAIGMGKIQMSERGTEGDRQ